MELSKEFVKSMEFVHPKDFMEQIQRQDRPDFLTRWIIKAELRPVDIYCYLYSRFGPPNGIQNFLRNNSSDNLIHWEWLLISENRYVIIQGLNFRTDIFISGNLVNEEEKEKIIGLFKDDFSIYGKKMGQIRNELEHWIEFVNPYQRIRRSVDQLFKDINKLDLNTSKDSIPDISEFQQLEEMKEKWDAQITKYNQAIGLSFGIRSMLPVMAEAYVNLLLYILMKTDLKKDQRLKDSLFRQPIDIRIRSLANNCFGFKQNVDYSNEICKQYHRLVNERNDLLHGNVVIDKLKFNEIYFNGNVPIFIEYSTLWERSFGVAHRSVGLDIIKEERKIVENLIDYLLSCIDDKLRDEIEYLSNSFELGLRFGDEKLGVLFSGRLADFNPGPPK